MREAASEKDDDLAPAAAARRPVKSSELLTAAEAARIIGVSVTTMYAWLGMSDFGLLVIRGQPFMIRYYQTGPRGQGRIHIERTEVERILEAMRVKPRKLPVRHAAVRQDRFPGIKVRLGRPPA